MASPLLTLVTVPLSWLRALSFMENLLAGVD
jgi:hypothetical protein